ncbi:MAG: hypothetical protein Q4D71_14165 [Oscillospiraceae bacterium]|nr:hypothetical protein [Oscillospiraceae bacterium]
MENKDLETGMASLNEEELESVSGGAGSSGGSWKTVECIVAKNYLALRNAPAYKYENEIAKIWPGTIFSVKPSRKSGDYIWAAYGSQQGWVNGNRKYIKYLN